MKHTLKVTFILVLLFLVAHLIGLFITNQYFSQELPFGIERPELDSGTSYIPLVFAILIATALALLLIKFGAMKLWKFWFIFATIYLLSIAFSSFMLQSFAILFAIIFGLLKFFRPTVITHNFTELFVYSGIAAIFAPIMNVFAASILLILISIYDAIAVWKTKHMIKMAKFQAKTKMFAGLVVPYAKGKKQAILGGGDIGFTLLFSGVVLYNVGFLNALIVSLFTTISLFVLLYKSKKNKFYPAMPYLSVGCFIGYFISLLF
jgi:presenilin-like A22 family membrane protease|tara:strand:- start:721 stop:1509 length:789 start_codon:yes stop_codon:yes gene_type:complete